MTPLWNRIARATLMSGPALVLVVGLWAPPSASAQQGEELLKREIELRLIPRSGVDIEQPRFHLECLGPIDRTDLVEDGCDSDLAPKFANQIATVALPVGLSYRLSLSDPEYWSPPIFLDLRATDSDGDEDTGAQQTPHPVEVYRSAVLKGRLTGIDRVDVLGTPSLTLSGPPDSHGRPTGLGRVTISCARKSREVTCLVPATPVDLRFQVDDFAPVYFVEIHPTPDEPIDLGPMVLHRGGSIIGWVEGLPESRDQVSVSARPAMGGWLQDPRERRRVSATRSEATTDQRGFFQLTGLSAGSYRVEMKQEGAAATVLTSILVEEGKETVLDDISLSPPIRLELALSPPAPVDQELWIVELQQDAEAAHRRDIVSDSPADDLGRWRSSPLSPGTYEIAIKTPDGSRWHTETVSLEPDSSFFAIEIPLVPIRGSISKGEDPLVSATLIFGGRHRPRQARFETDDNGEFTGYLPSEGRWELELARTDGALIALDPVSVELSPGREVVELEITVPETQLTGRVLDGGGQPIPKAVVLGVRDGADKRKDAEVRVDEEGRFALEMLAEGTIQLQATAEAGRSRWIDVQMIEGVETPFVELVIEESLALHGEVRAAGRPVSGAQIMIYPEGPSLRGVERTASNLDGSFTADLAAETHRATLLVAPPGFAARLYTRPVDEHGAPAIIDVPMVGGDLLLRQADGLSLSSAWLVYEAAAFPVALLQPLLYPIGRLDRLPEGILIHDLAPGRYLLCTDSTLEACTTTFVTQHSVANLLHPSSLPPQSDDPNVREQAEPSIPNDIGTI